MKKLLCALLCLCLVLGAAGCAKKSEVQLRDNSEDISYGGTLTGDIEGGRYFARNMIPVKQSGYYFSQAVRVSDDMIVMCANGEDATSSFCYTISTGEVHLLKMSFGGETISICAGEDGTVYTLLRAIGGIYQLRSNSGEAYSQSEWVDLEQRDEFSNMESIFCSNSQIIGNVWGDVYIINEDGSLGEQIAADLHAVTFVRSGSKTLICSGSSLRSGTMVYELDESNHIAAEYELGEYSDFFSGGEGELYAVNSSGILCQVDYKTGEEAPYCNLKLSACSANSFVYIDDESFFSLQNGWPMRWTASDLTDITVLTLATYDKNKEINRFVEAYNERNTGVIIDLMDYSVYDEEFEAKGLSRLAADIVSGSCPDIFDLNGLPAGLYASKGLFADLRPFFDKSEGLSYEALTPAAARCMSYGDKLVYLIPAFDVKTYCANADIVGDVSTISWEELLAMREQYSPYELLGLSRTEFLSDLMSFDGHQFVDYSNAACSFDTPLFVELLEFAKQLPEEEAAIFSEARAYNGIQVFCAVGGTPTEVMGMADGIFHSRAAVCGFPGGGVKMQPLSRFAMSAASEKQDAVWDFFSYLLSSEYLNAYHVIKGETVEGYYQIYSSIPSIAEYVEPHIDYGIDSLKKHEGEVLFAFTEDGIPADVPVSVWDESSKTRAMALLDRIDGIYEPDQAVLNIVITESAPFFAGDKSAEDTAKLIQSKAEIYLSEQFG